MKTLIVDDFLQWAATKGMGLDPRYPQSAVLNYRQKSDSRFWCIPVKPERRPHFIASLIKLMGDWRSCYIWRHLGSWPDPVPDEQSQINDIVELRILKGLGLPLGTNDVVEFDSVEFDSLVALLFSNTIFAWSGPEDLYIVPDHASQIILTDHHHVIHVSFRDPEEAQAWVSRMEELGFDLPKELPD